MKKKMFMMSKKDFKTCVVGIATHAFLNYCDVCSIQAGDDPCNPDDERYQTVRIFENELHEALKSAFRGMKAVEEMKSAEIQRSLSHSATPHQDKYLQLIRE